MSANERVAIAFCADLDGNEVYVGDQVAAATRNASGLRIGEVLEITGVYQDGIGYKRIRVKVRVDKATGGNSGPGSKYNRETERWEAKPYTMTYDGGSVVKLRG